MMACSKYSFLEREVDGVFGRNGPFRPFEKTAEPDQLRPAPVVPEPPADSSDSSDFSFSSAPASGRVRPTTTPSSRSIGVNPKGVDNSPEGVSRGLAIGGNNVARAASNAGFNVLSFLNFAANRANNNMFFMPGFWSKDMRLPEDSVDRWIESARQENNRWYDSGEIGREAKAYRDARPWYGGLITGLEHVLGAIPLAATGGPVGNGAKWVSSKLPMYRFFAAGASPQTVGNATRAFWTAGASLMEDPHASREFTRLGFGDLDTSWDKDARRSESYGDLHDYPYEEAKRFFDEHGEWPIYMGGKPYVYIDMNGYPQVATSPDIYRAATGNMAALDGNQWLKSRAGGIAAGSLLGGFAGVPRHETLPVVPFHVDENGRYDGGMRPTFKLDENGDAKFSDFYDDLLKYLEGASGRKEFGSRAASTIAHLLPYMLKGSVAFPVQVANDFSAGRPLDAAATYVTAEHAIPLLSKGMSGAGRLFGNLLPKGVRGPVGDWFGRNVQPWVEGATVPFAFLGGHAAVRGARDRGYVPKNDLPEEWVSANGLYDDVSAPLFDTLDRVDRRSAAKESVEGIRQSIPAAVAIAGEIEHMKKNGTLSGDDAARADRILDALFDGYSDPATVYDDLSWFMLKLVKDNTAGWQRVKDYFVNTLGSAYVPESDAEKSMRGYVTPEVVEQLNSIIRRPDSGVTGGVSD